MFVCLWCSQALGSAPSPDQVAGGGGVRSPVAGVGGGVPPPEAAPPAPAGAPPPAKMMRKLRAPADSPLYKERDAINKAVATAITKHGREKVTEAQLLMAVAVGAGVVDLDDEQRKYAVYWTVGGTGYSHALKKSTAAPSSSPPSAPPSTRSATPSTRRWWEPSPNAGSRLLMRTCSA